MKIPRGLGQLLRLLVLEELLFWQKSLLGSRTVTKKDLVAALFYGGNKMALRDAG